VYSTGGTLPNGQPGFGVITVHVTQTKPPTATAWTATTDCGDNFDCTSVIFPVTAGTNPVGGAGNVPYTPNSLLFNPAGTRAYLGSSKGLMFLDLSGQSPTLNTVSQATTPCNVAVCGKVLAISADGTRVVVADTKTVPPQVYIFDAAHATSPPTDLLIPGATAAAFSPDQMKIFILSDTGRMYVVSTVDALTSVGISASATGLAFAADGSFAYVAGTPGNSVSGYSVCTTNNVPDNVLNVPIPEFPLAISLLPSLQFDHLGRLAQSVLALTPPTIDIFTVGFAQNPLVEQPLNSGNFFCQPPTVQSDDADFPPKSFNLGQGTFTPLFMQVTGDGSQVILVAKNIPAVLIFDVSGGTTTAIPLVNNASPLAASATLDGTQVFVAACDADHVNPNTCGSIHIVNTQSGGDLQQAVYTNINTNDSMCNNLPGTACLPDLIAVRPQ
jgi:hypothetical protein